MLGIFAEVASGCLRRIDLFGRLGGEEFAAVLFDTTSERALAVGEEIRTRFAAATREAEECPVVATVSVGIVISHDAVLDLSTLLAQVASIELILDHANRGAADLMAAAAGLPASGKPAAKSAA